MKKFSQYEKLKKELEKEGVDWKPINKIHLGLIQQIETISETINILVETIEDDNDNIFISKESLETYLHDTRIVTAKLVGALNCELYIIYMENASVVRFYMRQLETFVNGINFFQEDSEQETIDKSHVEVLRNEIKIFKNSFKEWVTLLKKDDIDDEWNLY